MAYRNNIYGNAAYSGFLCGMLQGRRIHGTDSAQFTLLKASALAMATDVDALIAYDALVSVSVGSTNNPQLSPYQELVDAIVAADDFAALQGTAPDIVGPGLVAANEQWRAGILHDLCEAAQAGAYQTNAAIAATRTEQANAIFTAWAILITGLTVP